MDTISGRAARLAAFATLAAAPTYVIRFYPAFPILHHLSLDLLEICELATIILTLLASGLGTRLPWRNRYLVPALLLMLAATISVFVSPVRRAALGEWKDFFIEPALFGICLAWLAKGRTGRLMVLAGFGAGAVAVAVANLVTVAEAYATHQPNISVSPPVAIYTTPTAVALYLGPLVGLGLACALFYPNLWVRRTAWAVSVLSAAAVFFSYSRAGWAVVGLMVLFVAMFHRRRWSIYAVAAVCGLAFLAVPHVRARIVHELNPSDPYNSLVLRKYLWESAVRMLVHHPIFGAGLQGFQLDVIAYRVPKYIENLSYPHDIILNFWSETGLLGVVAFVWLLVAYAKDVIGGIRTATARMAAEARALWIGLAGALLAVIVHGLIDVPYFKNDLAMEWWALVGLAVALSAQMKLDKGRDGDGALNQDS